MDDARKHGGFRAAKDKRGNPIGRDGGPLYRQWMQAEGSEFKNTKPDKPNWLGGDVVEFLVTWIFMCPLSHSMFVFFPIAIPPEPEF